jgi:hypothetical protein
MCSRSQLRQNFHELYVLLPWRCLFMRIRSRFMKGISKARLIAADSTRIRSRFPANSCICTESSKLLWKHIKCWQSVREAYARGVSEKLGQIQQWFTHTKTTKKFMPIYFRRKYLVFDILSKICRFQSVRFLCVRTLKNPRAHTHTHTHTFGCVIIIIIIIIIIILFWCENSLLKSVQAF